MACWPPAAPDSCTLMKVIYGENSLYYVPGFAVGLIGGVGPRLLQAPNQLMLRELHRVKRRGSRARQLRKNRTSTLEIGKSGDTFKKLL